MTVTTQDPVRQYKRDGYALFSDVIDPALVEEARAHIDWLLEKHPELRPEQLDSSLIGMDPFWLRLVSDPRLLDIAERFLGPDIALFAAHYIAKRPFDGKPVLWHQDGSFWPLEPMEVMTVWLALDDTDRENGCMRVVPGTQERVLMDEKEMLETSPDENTLTKAMDPAQIPAEDAVDIVLKAGGLSVHNPNIIHGSDGNTSARWRRGLTIRYIPTTTRVTRETETPYLLRGEPSNNGQRYAAAPTFRAGEHMPFAGQEART